MKRRDIIECHLYFSKVLINAVTATPLFDITKESFPFLGIFDLLERLVVKNSFIFQSEKF